MELSFYEAGGVTIFSRKCTAICDDYRDTAGPENPVGIQRTSLFDALRTCDINGTGGATLAARAPDAFTPLC